MNDQSLTISKKTFISSVLILLLLMIIAGVLALTLPQGSYERIIENGREIVVANSYTTITDGTRLPFYRIFTAPFEVLFSDDAITIIGIIAFIVLISGSIGLLNQSGVMSYAMQKVVTKNKKNRYRLLFLVTFIFMFFGAFVGVYEESATLVPFAVALSLALGWDSLVGLGMSVLAAGFGFSTAVSNPFTLSAAQQIAGLPVYSGFLYHLLCFATVYAILSIFLYRYAKKIDRFPEKSLTYGMDRMVSLADTSYSKEREDGLKRATRIFIIAILLVVLVVVGGVLIPAIGSNALILMILPLTIGSIVAAKASRYSKHIFLDFLKGIIGMLPAILLILMASSIKLIVTNGQILDTILYYASETAKNAGGLACIPIIYAFVLILNFFIASGSAKAFLVVPIITPLADLVGITRQTAVLAFCFGDGFSNVIYPTNPVLLICLGMTVVSYGKWFKWTWKLQGMVLLVTTAFLFLAHAIQLGPF